MGVAAMVELSGPPLSIALPGLLRVHALRHSCLDHRCPQAAGVADHSHAVLVNLYPRRQSITPAYQVATTIAIEVEAAGDLHIIETGDLRERQLAMVL
jgi:hypothetical protein